MMYWGLEDVETPNKCETPKNEAETPEIKRKIQSR